MAPPAKRRKRNVVEESDEKEAPRAAAKPVNARTIPGDRSRNTLKRYLVASPVKTSNGTADEEPDSPPSPTRKASLRTAAKPAASGLPLSLSARNRGASSKASTKSPSASPEKLRGKGSKKGITEEKGKSGDLVALFSRQSQRNHLNGTANRAREAKKVVLEDIISDPISEDNDDILPSRGTIPSFVGKNAQKRSKEIGQTASSSLMTSSRFLRPPKSSASAPSSSAAVGVAMEEDQRPWSERYAPVNLDELAVHKKKVADVRKWLDDVFEGRMRQRLLVLKGAAGTAKTTTLQLLAKDMNVEVLEWRNPANALGATHGFQSASAQFEEFLGRGGKFGQLDLDSEQTPTQNDFLDSSSSSHRRLIMIEEFPNTFMRTSTALRSFRNTILQFLAANTPSLAMFGHPSSSDPIIPVVMIISETLLTTTSASADSFTAHRLLGPEILRHPGCGVIEFNSIAPTFLAKALDLVVQKEARKSGRRRTPGPQVLQKVGEIGDIRSAISSLEFLCIKGDNDADWGAKVTAAKPKRGGNAPAMTQSERDSLELISQREASLGIFHAVGKVVYNKRDEQPFPSGSVEAEAEVLPDYMAHLSRPKRSQVCVDTLIDETGTDTHTFISALHENYPLSCERNGPQDPNSSLDYINGCIEHLSESDLLCPSWDIFFGGKGFGGGNFGKDSGSHILRQDEMAFQTAVRGLLFSLPSPVKRQTHGGRSRETFSMYYPTSLKLWRAKEELESLIDMWATKMLKGEDGIVASSQNGASSSLTSNSFSGPFRKPKSIASGSSNVGDFITNQKSLNYPSSQLARADTTGSSGSTPTSATPLLSLGNSARQEMLLERLPYMAHIARRKRCSFGTMRIRDLDRIVTFQGIGPPKTDDSDGDDAGDADDVNAIPAEAWATDKPGDEPSPRKKRGLGAILGRPRTTKGGADEMAAPVAGPLQGLVISDDDIEDD